MTTDTPTRRAHDRFLESGVPSSGVRDLVVDSWRRSAEAGVDVDRPDAVVALEREELIELRNAHPLNEVMPLLRSTLVSMSR